jgi:ABC-type polar amino acid transport system ATPase subunit
VPDVEVLSPPIDSESGPATRDLSDIVGQPDVVEALITAAAGGHHMFLLGPPGAGKTMVAERLVDVLPDLTPDESLEVTSIASLARVANTSSLITRPPFVAPHHTATAVAIVGGGSGIIRPGAVSRASRGVLFLDEATASLDPASVHRIEEIVARRAAAGTRVFFISHDIAQARRLADDVLFLCRGQVDEQAPAARFFDAPATEVARDYLAGRIIL